MPELSVETPTDDLLVFLVARLDEAEATARDATPGPWSPDDDCYTVLREPIEGDPDEPEEYRAVCEGFALSNQSLRANVRHVAAHDPRSILADVEAKRALIDDVFDYEQGIDGEWGCCCSSDYIRAGGCPRITVDEIKALRILASVYRHHADYRSEWAPEVAR